MDETLAVIERYEKRKLITDDRYNPLNPSVYMGLFERKKALIKLIKYAQLTPVDNKKVLEIGCGSGSNLNELITLGFSPKNLSGNELLEDRVIIAKQYLPAEIQMYFGDACELNLDKESFDIIYQSTVFTSLLDDKFQEKLANKMWTLVKPGGGILWYDFIYNNPKNPDVRGVPVSRIKQLFPQGNIKVWHVTLMPPISRAVCKIHPCLYTFFNLTPLFRSHVLCWISKP